MTLDGSPGGRAAWPNSPAQWRQLVPPCLSRVRTGLGVTAQPDSATEWYMSRLLAARAAEVRWGSDALDEFALRTDATVLLAISSFSKLQSLLAAPPR